MEGLGREDLPIEPSSNQVMVSEETSSITVTTSEELLGDQQQSPTRKRKLQGEKVFGNDPHEPALKVLHVEERYVDVQTNGNSQSLFSVSASQLENEQRYMTSHRAALEELLEADDDRSGDYHPDSLEGLRSADMVENPEGVQFNGSFSDPRGLAMQGGLQCRETLAEDVDNALRSNPPLSVLQTLDIMEHNSRFSGIDPRAELQCLHVVEMTAKDEAKVSTGNSQLELEAPAAVVTHRNDLEPLNIVENAAEDAANVILTDGQSELEVVEKGFEDYTMRLNNPYAGFVPMNLVGGGAEDESHLGASDPRQGLEALNVVQRSGEEGANVTLNNPRLGFHPIDLEELRKNQFNMTLNNPRSDFQTLNADDSSPKADEAHVSISGPLSKLLEAQLLQAHHVPGDYEVNETQVPGSAPQSYLAALRDIEIACAEEDHSKMPVGGPSTQLEAPFQVEGNLLEDQPAARKKKMVLLASVAAFFSTLAGALGSIGELVGQLEKAAIRATGISENYPTGQFQPTGMEGLTSTSSLSESPALRLHADMTRSSSSLRNNIVVLMFLLMQQNRKRAQKRPRELTGPWYIKPRSAQSFDTFLDLSPRGDPEKFRELFRITPALFFHICEMVSTEMLSDTPRSLRILPNRVLTVERQVAIAIRRLATGNQFLGIADSFGVSKSTAVKVTWKFIVALIKKARPVHLNWPNAQQLKQIKDGFKSQWGFPNCCGAVDGTHFTVEFPKGEDVSQYYDHQNHVSISMQAIVSPDLRFLDVVVGWPGSIQEYQLLQNTNFFRSIVVTKDRLSGDPYITQDGSSLREYVLGDGGYPLYDWLMVPYPDGLSAARDEWNSKHAVARQCVENALVRLKGTWKILSRILWKPRKERIGKMVFACCLLHNMIIEHNDGLNPEVYAGVNPHPGGYGGVSVPTAEVFEKGPEAREVLFREVMGGGIV